MGLARRIALNAGAQLAGQVVVTVGGVAAVAITVRYLGIKDYGTLITGVVFVSLFTLFTDFGFSAIGAREISKRPEAMRKVLSNVIILGTVTSVLVAGAATGLAWIVYPGSSNSALREIILILLPHVLLGGLRSAADAYLVAQQRVYLSALAGVISRVATLGLVAAVAAANLGIFAMAGAYAAVPLLTSGLVVFFVREAFHFKPSWDAAVMLDLFRSSLPMGAVSVVNIVYVRLDLILLSVLSTRPQVAIYAVAYKVIESLLTLPQFIMVTVFPSLSRAEAWSRRLGDLVENAFRGMLLVAVPLVALGFDSKSILSVLAGNKFGSGALALQLLMTGTAISYLSLVFGHAMIAQNLQSRALLVSVLALAVNLALNLVLIPAFAANGAASAVIVSEIVAIIGLAYFFRRLSRLPTFYAPVRTLLAGMAMVGAVIFGRFVLDGLSVPAFPALVAVGLASSLVYLFALRQLGAVPPTVRRAAFEIVRRRASRAETSPSAIPS